jgi:glucokinase
VNRRAPSGDVTFGVDIGGTKVLGVALDGETVVEEARVATPVGVPSSGAARAVAEAVLQVVETMAGALGTGPGLRLGVGVPGMVDRQGRLRHAPNLIAATGGDFPALFADLAPEARVRVENDANFAALGEYQLGAGKGVDDVLMVTLGTGIGGGIIAGGRLLLGGAGFAGEIGHMVVDPSGPPCPCGRRGCWERYASGGGLGRLAREAAHAGTLPEVVALAGGDPENVRGEHVTASARAGDPGALAVMSELGWWVALGLTNLTAVIDPARIVLGGGLAEAGELLLDPTRAAFAELIEGGASRPTIAIVGAALGERAGAIGAACAVRHGFEGAP